MGEAQSPAFALGKHMSSRIGIDMNEAPKSLFRNARSSAAAMDEQTDDGIGHASNACMYRKCCQSQQRLGEKEGIPRIELGSKVW
jgi:hypothetical protein